MNPELEKRIIELEAVVKSLRASTTIPFDIRNAFSAGSGVLTFSSKGATSENQAVNEAGSATYDVLKKPDAFLQITIDGSVKFIPIFT